MLSNVVYIFAYVVSNIGISSRVKPRSVRRYRRYLRPSLGENFWQQAKMYVESLKYLPGVKEIALPLRATEHRAIFGSTPTLSYQGRGNSLVLPYSGDSDG